MLCKKLLITVDPSVASNTGNGTKQHVYFVFPEMLQKGRKWSMQTETAIRERGSIFDLRQREATNVFGGQNDSNP